jgi:hypothetical protein
MRSLHAGAHANCNYLQITQASWKRQWLLECGGHRRFPFFLLHFATPSLGQCAVPKNAASRAWKWAAAPGWIAKVLGHVLGIHKMFIL